jgi:hypothetical protein
MSEVKSVMATPTESYSAFDVFSKATAMVFVPYGLVLAQIQVQVQVKKKIRAGMVLKRIVYGTSAQFDRRTEQKLSGHWELKISPPSLRTEEPVFFQQQ